MNYSELPDLNKIKDFAINSDGTIIKERLKFCHTEEYITAFEQQIKNNPDIDIELKTWFAYPMINGIFDEEFYEKTPYAIEKKSLEEKLEKYEEYVTTDIFKEIILSKINPSLSYSDEELFWGVNKIDILNEYFLNSGEDKDKLNKEFNESVSEQLDKTQVTSIVEEFPIEYLTKSALQTIGENIKNTIKSPKPDEIIPHLKFMQEATNKTFLKKGYAGKIINENLNTYLETNVMTSQKVNDLITTLDENFVPKELYKEVVHHSIGFLLNSKSTKPKAEKLYNQAKKDGWLNEELLSEKAKKHFSSDDTTQT